MRGVLKDLTYEQRQKLVNAIYDGNATFMFFPSPQLKEAIVSGNDEKVNKLPKEMMKAILNCSDGYAINLGPDIVMKYIDGTIDENNKYIISLGRIEVV